DRVDKEYLRRAPEFVENWGRRAGRILYHKIASGDVKFFRELADAVEEFSKGTRSIESFRRFIAIEYKLLCAPLSSHLLPKDSRTIPSVAILAIPSTLARYPK